MDSYEACAVNIHHQNVGVAEGAISDALKREDGGLVNELLLQFQKGMSSEESFNFKEQLNACHTARRHADPHLPDFHIY